MELQITKGIKNKTCIYDIRKVLYWIFYLYGLDLNYKHVSKMKRYFTWLCQILSAIILTITFFHIYGVQRVEFDDNVIDKMKVYYSSLVVIVCSLIIYCFLIYSRIEM